jgi:hypothetical protein
LSTDHVFKQDDGWWFWDEMGVDPYGPFETEEKAREEMAKYVHWLTTGERPNVV